MRAPDDGGERKWPLGRRLGERMWPLGRRAEDFVLWGCSDSRMLESLSILHLPFLQTDGTAVNSPSAKNCLRAYAPCLCSRMLRASNIFPQS